MYNFKNIIWLLAIGLLLASCGIFGGNTPKKAKPGEIVWRVPNSEVFTISTQPAIDGKQVYVIQDASIKALLLSNGQELWRHKICQSGAECDYSHKIIYSNTKVFYDQGYNIKAFDKKNGKQIWKTHITDIPDETSGIGSPVMSQDAKYLFAGRDGYVVKLRKSDGKIVRRFMLDRMVPEGENQGSTNPIISPFGDNILYVPASYYNRSAPNGKKYGANMFAFDAGTGELIWEKHLKFTVDNPYPHIPKDSLTASPPIYDIALTASSIIALQGKLIVSINRHSGKIQWFKFFPQSGFKVGLSVKKDAIYAASNGHYAYKLDLKTGEVIWTRDIFYSSSSITTVENGRLYFVNNAGGAIWVLDTKDGSVIYRELPPNYKNDDYDVYISSLAVGEGYMVDVGSKAVYCLTVP